MSSAASTVYLGTYSAGGGIRPISKYDPLKLEAAFTSVQNCSFGAFDRQRSLAYFVDEQVDGKILICRLGDAGWQVLAEHAVGGKAPCYAALDPSRMRLAVANYGSGSVALFVLDPHSGFPIARPDLWVSEGSGPVQGRQDEPHVHCTIFDQSGRLYAVDLGTDRIFTFAPSSPSLEPEIAFHAPPGSGPRHLTFHPDLPVAYLISELAGTVTVLDREGPLLHARATINLAPEGFAGENLGGHMSLNRAGTRLYATNRGHDSIAVLSIDQHGNLDLLQHIASQGASPRSFVLLEDEQILLVANEEGETVAAMPIDPTGLLGEAVSVASAPGAAFLFSVS